MRRGRKEENGSKLTNAEGITDTCATKCLKDYRNVPDVLYRVKMCVIIEKKVGESSINFDLITNFVEREAGLFSRRPKS